MPRIISLILYFCALLKEKLIWCGLGKGGSKIAEIRQMSGANIQISKSADKEPTAERQIQITGNHEWKC
jgi:KH domain